MNERLGKFHRLALGAAALVVASACGASSTSGIPPQEAPPPEPVTAAELRARWEKLATTDESDIVGALDQMATLAPDARSQKLGQARQAAGFIKSALSHAPPPAELKACHAIGLEGVTELNAALDGIDRLWLGRGTPGADRRAESERLAGDVCQGLGKLAAGRIACGVTARVPSPLLCAAH